MTRPHERLGIKKPIVRRLPNKFMALNAVVLVATVFLSIGYILQVNQASARGFLLRDKENQIEDLRTNVLILEDKAARLSSLESLGEQADSLGMVSVNYVEYIHPASKSYALR
ncbi:MAG: hypothetical protein NUV81_01690 [bacterium]|nr:hypothetical protein [bacterium]